MVLQNLVVSFRECQTFVAQTMDAIGRKWWEQSGIHRWHGIFVAIYMWSGESSLLFPIQKPHVNDNNLCPEAGRRSRPRSRRESRDFGRRRPLSYTLRDTTRRWPSPSGLGAWPKINMNVVWPRAKALGAEEEEGVLEAKKKSAKSSSSSGAWGGGANQSCHRVRQEEFFSGRNRVF